MKSKNKYLKAGFEKIENRKIKKKENYDFDQDLFDLRNRKE